MTNDINTLNGALSELGETMADNLTTMGVTASASDGLTTLAGKILDIQGGEAIVLTTNKNILSYADSETATLTATHSGGAGKTVEIYNATTGTKIGDATDNNDGTYTYTYNSTGVGDISMTATSGTTESNSITIEDCIKAGFTNWTGTYTTGTDTYDYIQPSSIISPNISLPSSFKIEYKFYNTNNDTTATGTGLWIIGADTDNGVLIGHEGTDRRIRIYSRSSGSNTVRATENTVYTYQTWTDALITYNNGTISLTVGGKTISYSLSSTNVMQTYAVYSALRLAEFKIKPLTTQ